jgi:TorA maturation chaperone TorD
MSTSPVTGLSHEQEQEEIALSTVADLRCSAYRLFAVVLDNPKDLELQTITEAAEEFCAEEGFAVVFPFYPDWQVLLARLAALSEQGLDRARADYRRLFNAYASEPPCPPNESFYIAQSGEDAGMLRSQLQQRYTQAGLTLAPDMARSPDHVVVELDFMAFLCAYESRAWTGSGRDGGVRTLKREAVFLRKHLGAWLPRFARRIRRQDPGGFYAQVISVAEAFVHHDQDLITLLLTSEEQRATAHGGAV